MSKPSNEALGKYDCTEGKILLVCDFCGLLFCDTPGSGYKDSWSSLIIHKCYACKAGGLK